MELNEVKMLITNFEDLKHTDENGVEYWNAHELSKAMGYNDYRNFNQAIKRAKQSIETSGKNSENYIVGSTEVISNINKGGTTTERKVDGYKMTRYGAYNVAINADVSKPEVAFAQEYFITNSAKYEMIAQRLNDRATIFNRNALSIANKTLNAVLVEHDVKPEELGIVADAGDQGFFNMHTKELKEIKNIPNNKPVADMMGETVSAYKVVAQLNTKSQVRKQDAQGVDETSEIAYDNNREMRDMFIRKFDDSPEDSMTCEDIKKVEQRYKKFTKEQLKAIEQEF